MVKDGQEAKELAIQPSKRGECQRHWLEWTDGIGRRGRPWARVHSGSIAGFGCSLVAYNGKLSWVDSADACCTASEGTTMSLLTACLEERVTVGVDESFTWNESTQECSKFSDFEYRYFAPSDTGMKGNFFTLPGDGSPTIESRDDCCKASNAGQDVALL